MRAVAEVCCRYGLGITRCDNNVSSNEVRYFDLTEAATSQFVALMDGHIAQIMMDPLSNAVVSVLLTR